MNIHSISYTYDHLQNFISSTHPYTHAPYATQQLYSGSLMVNRGSIRKTSLDAYQEGRFQLTRLNIYTSCCHIYFIYIEKGVYVGKGCNSRISRVSFVYGRRKYEFIVNSIGKKANVRFLLCMIEVQMLLVFLLYSRIVLYAVSG